MYFSTITGTQSFLNMTLGYSSKLPQLFVIHHSEQHQHIHLLKHLSSLGLRQLVLDKKMSEPSIQTYGQFKCRYLTVSELCREEILREEARLFKESHAGMGKHANIKTLYRKALGQPEGSNQEPSFCSANRCHTNDEHVVITRLD